MLRHPVLSRFDYWAKVDVDVCFRLSMNLTRDLVRSGSWFMHTRLQQDNAMCERSLGEFMANYTARHSCAATNEALAWQEGALYPKAAYANFIAGWLGFWQSNATRYFAEQWHGWEGGWVNRWSDQQFWMPALRVANVSEERIVDWSHLRYRTFDHSKSFGFCNAPRPKRNATQRKVLSEDGRWVPYVASAANG